MIWVYAFASFVPFAFSYRNEIAARIRMGAGYARLLVRMGRRRIVTFLSIPKSPAPVVAKLDATAQYGSDTSDDERLPPE